MPSNIGAIAAKYGLGWGGNWRTSKDAMHFSIAAGEGGSVALDRNSVAPLPGSPQAQTQTAGLRGVPAAAPGTPTTGTGGVGGIQAPGGNVTVGTAGAGAAPGSIAAIKEVGPGYNVVQLADGSVERREGARNWRNNNPGNIQFGQFAQRYGALGSDGRFAIFPSYEDGRKAKEALLFESSGYKGMNIQQAIYRYAPPNENNSANYAATVAAAAGVSISTPLGSLSDQQKQAMLNSMEKVEGFRSGRVTKMQDATGGGNTQVASAPAAAPSAAAPSGAGAGPAAAPAGPQTGTGGIGAIQAPGGGGGDAGSKPSNVSFESGKVDISKVNPALVQGLFSAARDYGKPVRINSAFRDDEYQAQLWVRGNILHEPGIFTPAKPENPQTIQYRGQTYNVPGSGRGSSHGRGQAMDISPDVRSDFAGFLAKYGVGFPYGASDPVHIEMGRVQYASNPTPRAYAAGDPSVPNTGPAIVGERGSELVVGKDGSSRLTGSGAHVENLNQGDSVVPADKTKKLMGYAEGTADIMKLLPAVNYEMDKNSYFKKGELNRYETDPRPDLPLGSPADLFYNGDEKTRKTRLLDYQTNPDSEGKSAFEAGYQYRGFSNMYNKAGDIGTPEKKMSDVSYSELVERSKRAPVETLKPGEGVFGKLEGYAEGTFHADNEYLKYNPLGGLAGDRKINESLVQFRRRAMGQRISESVAEDKKGFERIQKGADGTDYGDYNKNFYYDVDVGGKKSTATGHYNPITDKHYAPQAAIKQSIRSSPEALKSKIDMWNINANALSENNAIREYTEPPAVKPIIINNTNNNNLTNTVIQQSSMPSFDRSNAESDPFTGGSKSRGVEVGAF